MDDNSCIRVLALAVIARAIRDISDRHDIAKALAWIASEECQTWCEVAEIDHAALLERSRSVVV